MLNMVANMSFARQVNCDKQAAMVFQNILIVCVGNICRSPMAEGLLKKTLSDAQKPGYTVRSAGLGALVGSAPDPIACKLMSASGIDISDIRSRQLSAGLLRAADIVLVMEASHKRTVEAFDPATKGKVFRLGHWGNFDIPDPYQKDETAFSTAFNLIEQAVSQWSVKI